MKLETKFTLATIIAVTGICITSCTPQSYIVNTAPYTEEIKINPEKVVMAPEHVEPVGGFQSSIGGTFVTDQGEVTVSPSGVSGNVVIDLRSGK